MPLFSIPVASQRLAYFIQDMNLTIALTGFSNMKLELFCHASIISHYRMDHKVANAENAGPSNIVSLYESPYP